MTNFEYIKSLDVESLATYFTNIFYDSKGINDTIHDLLLDWLQEEYK